MYKNQIIELLSNHRQPLRAELPQPLSLHTIAALIQESLSPNQTPIKTQIETDLKELEAEGEVLAGTGNRFCMGKPVLLAENEDNLTGLLFQGDRAYLKLAHQALETEQPTDKTQLHPRIQRYELIKERLQNYGIGLLTTLDTIEHLTPPELPKPSLLKGSERVNPFAVGNVRRYTPKPMKQQCDRWQAVLEENLNELSLLRLATGEYIWFDSGQFYELTPDVATLTMFQIDRDTSTPLLIPWDENEGRLNLQGVYLPAIYARLLGRLSKASPGSSRSRLFEPINRPKAKEIILRLGCTLV
ncbi:MAG: hypothetical protein N5P05_003644 [Chroococcopsis gigantea SAG 12.99]|jgi:hypothetical protein|nr:hypothetical protein [Chroococcopsis gigantea SAG 12.99]